MNPSNITQLDRLMAAVLAQLELASHTPAASNEAGTRLTHSKPGGNQPPRIQQGYKQLGHRYRTCRNDEDRKVVIGEALAELRSLRYSKRAGHSGTREGRKLIGLDDRPISVLCHVYGYSESHIYRLRREARKAA